MAQNISFIFKKKPQVPTGISIPYSEDFSTYTNGQAFDLGTDWTSSEDPPALYNESITSYNSSWAGGLEIYAQDQEMIESIFYLHGNFSNVGIYGSPANGIFSGGNNHAVMLEMYDSDKANRVLIYNGRTNGTSDWHVQVRDAGSNNYNYYVGAINYETYLRVDRSGNTLYFYDGDTLKASKNFNNLPPDLKFSFGAQNWQDYPSQTYMIDRIRMDTAELYYEETLDNFDSGTNGQEPDSNLWSISGNSPANSAVYNNGKLRFSVTGTNLFAILNEKISGDFSVIVDFDLITAPSSSWWVASLQAQTENEDGVYVGRFAAPTQNIRRAYREDGGAWQLASNISSSASSGKLMITRQGSVLKAWYNVGSAGFVPYTAPITCDSTDVTITLALQASAGVSASIDFDNLVVIRQS